MFVRTCKGWTLAMPTTDLFTMIIVEVGKVSFTAFIDGIAKHLSVLDPGLVLILELPAVVELPERRFHVCSVA